jgi:hypothetical protein
VADYVAAKLKEDTCASSSHLVTPAFREDGPPAVPNPEPRDRDWKPGRAYMIVPDRPDGKPTFSNT